MGICFTPDDNVRNYIPSIVIDCNLVETVEYAMLLGVTLSNDLTWNKHVECIVKKTAKRLYMLYQLKRAGISQLDLVTVYISVVRPVLKDMPTRRQGTMTCNAHNSVNNGSI